MAFVEESPGLVEKTVGLARATVMKPRRGK